MPRARGFAIMLLAPSNGKVSAKLATYRIPAPGATLPDKGASLPDKVR